jgi:hypothetical protein
MLIGHVPAARFRTRLTTLTATFVIVTLVILTLHPHSAEKARQYGILRSNEDVAHDPIPSIVHYVQLKQDANSTLSFPFSSFLTMCATVMYIQPTQIYMHTDFNDLEIRNASARGDRWTKAVINTFADIITWKHVSASRFAGPSQENHISATQHKSDFIRWEAIAETGGIYMDWDVFPLRPLTPLLNAGFAFIGGRHYGGFRETGAINGTINNGVFMTKPNSAMARIVVREQHAGFNGAWECNLQSMTKIAERLVPIPNQVLILDRTAFAPTHWGNESTNPLFIPNRGRPSPVPKLINSTDPTELYENAVLNRRKRAEWEMDFSSTYMLHAFHLRKYYEYVNPKTILSRTSNFGIATYDVVRHMVDVGYITGNEGRERTRSY